MIPEPHDLVEIRELRVGERGAPVLEDITLGVRPGEIFGVLGRAGAGKTSLLKAVLRLVEPAAGTVRLFGEAHDHPEARARLAWLPQRFRPPGHLSGYGFVRLTLAFHGCHARRPRIAGLAERIDLERSALRRPVREYGKSMAQKLGLVALLLSDRPLLVLDEPMSGLAPTARRLVRQQLAAERARGRTILLASGVPADHEGLCDRIAILHGGRLACLGTPEQIEARHGAPTLHAALLAAIERVRPLPAAAPSR